MMGARLTHFALTLFVLVLSPNLQGANEPLQVVASFSIIGDMVEEVAGDLAEVRTIVGPDSDAHVYRPSIADAQAVAKADVIFFNGLGFETWATRLVASSGTSAALHSVSDGVSPIRVDGVDDPHAWNSLSNGVIYVRNIAAALTQALPSHKAQIQERTKKYIQKLENLDAEIHSRVAKLSSDRRTVVTVHDAFGYLASAYDLTFLAPQGIDTESEPSARDLAALIAQLRNENVTALFVENISNPALIQQIAEETGSVVGGRLYSDALSGPNGPAPSYFGMFRHNMNAVLDALEAPKNF